MGKGLKEFQLCDSARKLQDAQDDVTELFDLFDAHFWGWYIEFRLRKAVSPQTEKIIVHVLSGLQTSVAV